MRKDLLILALGLFAVAGTAAGEDLAVPESGTPADEAMAPETPAADAPPPDAPLPPAAPAMLPAKGTTMGAVKKQFGEPMGKHGPVGGDSPKHPPITRWDYDGFMVIFEKDRVIDAVVPGAPPRLRNTAGLTRAKDAPPPPYAASAATTEMPADMPAEAPAEAPMETPAAPAPEEEAIIPEAPAEEMPQAAEPTAEMAPAATEAPAEAPPAEMAPAGAAPAEAPAAPAPQPTEPETIPDDAPPTPK